MSDPRVLNASEDDGWCGVEPQQLHAQRSRAVDAPTNLNSGCNV